MDSEAEMESIYLANDRMLAETDLLQVRKEAKMKEFQPSNCSKGLINGRSKKGNFRKLFCSSISCLVFF